MTEGNGPTARLCAGFYHYTLPSSVPAENFVRLADYQSRYMTRVLSMGVKKIFLYSINVGGECAPDRASFNAWSTTMPSPIHKRRRTANWPMSWRIHNSSNRSIRQMEFMPICSQARGEVLR